MHQLDESILPAELEQILVQLKTTVVFLILFPLQEILLFSFDAAVFQTLRIVARKDELHSAEEPLVKLRLLVREALTNAVADTYAAVFQLQHSNRDAVDVQYQVWPTLMI